MRLPFVTKSLAISVTLLSVYNAAFSFWGAVKTVAKAAEGELEKGPRPEVDAYLLKLVLGKTPPWALWTLLTTSLIETQLVPFLIVLVLVCTGGRYCEKMWSTKSYATFVLVMLTGTTFVQTVLWKLLANPPIVICGANGLLAGIVVALRQMIPGHTIIFFRNRVRIQIKWLPLSFLILVTILQTLGLEENVGAYYLGFISSWYYLRYHHVVDGIGSGDASDSLSFANFFPNPLATWIEPVLDRIYYLLSSRLHIIREFSIEEINEGNQRYAARLSGALLPIKGARITTERRKMMLRAIDAGL